MEYRIWYPQFDIYDTVRRIIMISHEWRQGALGLERLYITDFYLCNPPLLYDVEMTRRVRNDFLALDHPRPEKSFLSYPDAPILFFKMKSIQEQAIQALIGKGLIDIEALKLGEVKLTERGRVFMTENLMSSVSDLDQQLIRFLVNSFSKLGAEDMTDLRKRTGLRRIT